uniref:GOST seven transmembrane domain-containing protein n=1 Tax=Araucaria cunninghamii TaxID=56994 RepID=A0A0D6QXL7_ARACU
MARTVLGALIVIGLLVEVNASIHEYNKGRFSVQGNSFFFYGGSEGLYASQNQNETGGTKGKSFIKFESISFKRSKEAANRHQEMEHTTGLIEAIVFEIKDRNKIGGSLSVGSTVLCCTHDLAKEDGCKQGEIIVHPSDEPGWPKRKRIFFNGNDEIARMQPDSIIINKSGMYNLYFMFCDPNLKGVVVSGKTIWKNTMGYLPGRMAPFLKFYGFMSLCYLILGLIWFLQYVRFWKDILQLQNCITIVIALGMCEMATWYFEYANFNATGHRPIGITIWAVTFGSVKKTVSRLLLLVVSMGYGVVRPTLGGLTSKVLLLGAIYFVASEALELVENVGNINDLSGKARLFLVLPVAVLDAFFILWIFTSLSKTLEKLQARRSFAKLELYRKFTNSLAMAVVLSVAWIGYELYFKATDPFTERWRNAWIITAFWILLAFVLLCVICVLWAPSHNATRYAYSEETGEDFDEDEAVALTAVGVKSTLDVAGRVDRKERRVVNSDVFSLAEDLEEDKRE